MADDEKEAPELQVARIFQLAGYEVSQAVGTEPGKVDWFAAPREGFVRPKTYWRAWTTCPERLEEALAELEQARVAKGADRAFAVVLSGQPAFVSCGGLHLESTSVITYRRLVLELGGIVRRVQASVAEYERQQKHERFMPLRCTVGEMKIDDAAAYVDEWARSEATSHLVVTGGLTSGRTAVFEHAMYIAGRRFLEAPDTVPAIVESGDAASGEASIRGWMILGIRDTSHGTLAPQLAALTLGLGSRALFRADSAEAKRLGDVGANILVLEKPTTADYDAWYQTRFHASPEASWFLAARARNAALAHLSNSLPNLSTLSEAVFATRVHSDSVDERVAHVVLEYVRRVEIRAEAHRSAKPLFEQLEAMALELFALGRCSNEARGAMSSANRGLPKEMLAWTSPPVGARYDWIRPDVVNGGGQMPYVLIHHCFVARKIAREVMAGNDDILVRYQFPREYVLLFLSILAPDIASRVVADRSDELRAQIESEVERRLQSTLAHMLKRSAGAARAHVKAIQRQVERATPGALSYEFARVEEELKYQSALAEQTRLWHEVPESEVEGLSLRGYVHIAVKNLADTHANVACSIDIDDGLCIRASRDGLTEILHCLLENAFHAVAFAEGLADRRVRVEARLDGETIRLDVLDNGPGIAPADRERIFKPYETTKKGGDSKPLGTGMGLPIARRYAEHVGAQVGIDPDKEQTCFFVRFVAWRELG